MRYARVFAAARSVLEICAIGNLLNPGLKVPPRLSHLLHPLAPPLIFLSGVCKTLHTDVTVHVEARGGDRK